MGRYTVYRCIPEYDTYLKSHRSIKNKTSPERLFFAIFVFLLEVGKKKIARLTSNLLSFSTRSARWVSRRACHYEVIMIFSILFLKLYLHPSLNSKVESGLGRQSNTLLHGTEWFAGIGSGESNSTSLVAMKQNKGNTATKRKKSSKRRCKT